MKHRIAAIPGDGIGKEVVPEGQRVLDAAARRFGFELEWTSFDWSCEVYARTGRMMPEDGLDQLVERLGIDEPLLDQQRLQRPHAELGLGQRRSVVVVVVVGHRFSSL